MFRVPAAGMALPKTQLGRFSQPLHGSQRRLGGKEGTVLCWFLSPPIALGQEHREAATGKTVQLTG